MKRVIISGSPRSNGRSAHLSEMLFEACIDECPDDEVTLIPVGEVDVAPCIGCDACRASEGHECAIEDDMDEIRPLLDETDELVVVSPVYFSGVPAQLKALLDRLQPYFWTWERGGARRPATLHVVGESSGPAGFEPLIGEVSAALAVAGFRVERVVDWVGKITAEGEITAEGDEYVPQGSQVKFARIDASDIEEIHVAHNEALRAARKAAKQKKGGQGKGAGGQGKGASGAQKKGAQGGAAQNGRPKLDLSEGNQGKRHG